jgi:transposase
MRLINRHEGAKTLPARGNAPSPLTFRLMTSRHLRSAPRIFQGENAFLAEDIAENGQFFLPHRGDHFFYNQANIIFLLSGMRAN